MREIEVTEFKNKIYDYESKERMLENGKFIIIDFYADWCQPCKFVDKNLQEIENEMDNIEIVKVDAEEQFKLTEFFNIRNLPTLIFIDKNGNLHSETGSLPKPTLKKKIEEKIN